MKRCCVQMESYDNCRDLNIYSKLSLILCIYQLIPPGSEVWPVLDVFSELKPEIPRMTLGVSRSPQNLPRESFCHLWL